MKAQDRKLGNYIAWARNSDGYLKECVSCGRTIYMHRDSDATWRPYASWQAGDVAPGEFWLHDCPHAE